MESALVSQVIDAANRATAAADKAATAADKATEAAEKAHAVAQANATNLALLEQRVGMVKQWTDQAHEELGTPRQAAEQQRNLVQRVDALEKTQIESKAERRTVFALGTIVAAVVSAAVTWLIAVSKG